MVSLECEVNAIVDAALVNTLSGPLAALREAEIKLLNDIATALAELGESAADDRRRLVDVSTDLRTLFFLVVVIGEFNAGKSSFVNALLGEPLLPMGITPTTEAIELIRYADLPNHKPNIRDDGIREWEHPNTGAPGVAIVDTPGTGSVFEKHEKTAKAFLHRSDLVIFVISAKRAFAQTEKLYLELAKSYGKKIILVVNQADLLQANEQQEVRRFIEQQVKELLDLQPLIFMVSAKEALAGQSGGMEGVRAHLRGVFSEAPPAKQKLLAQLDMAQSIVNKYRTELQTKADLVTVDTARVRDVQAELEQQSLGLDKQLRAAREDIDKVFMGIRQRGMTFIDTNLSIRKLGRSIDKQALQTEFQEVVIGRALRDIDDATEGYVNAVVDNSRLYWRGVIERLGKIQELMDQEITGLDANVYAEQRESLENAIAIAEGELKTYSSGKVLNELTADFETNLSGFRDSALAAVGGLIAMLIAVATPGPLIGIGAAAPVFVLGAIAAAPGSVLAIRYYRRITAESKENFNERVDLLEDSYYTALDDLTQKERARLGQYGNRVLTPIFSRLEALAKRYGEQQNVLKGYLDQIDTLRKGIEEIKA